MERIGEAASPVDARDFQTIMVDTAGKSDFDPDSYLEAGLGLLDLRIDPDWAPAIVANLKVLHQAAALVRSFELPDEAEAAPVYDASSR